MDIAKLKDFNLEILSHCLSYGGCSNPSAADDNSGDGGAAYVLFEAAKESLLQHISALVEEELPRPFQVYRTEREWRPAAAEAR